MWGQEKAKESIRQKRKKHNDQNDNDDNKATSKTAETNGLSTKSKGKRKSVSFAWVFHIKISCFSCSIQSLYNVFGWRSLGVSHRSKSVWTVLWCIPHDEDFGSHRNEKKNAHRSGTQHTHIYQLKKMKVRNSHAYILYFTTGKSNLRRIALKSGFGNIPSSCSAIWPGTLSGFSTVNGAVRSISLANAFKKFVT